MKTKTHKEASKKKASVEGRMVMNVAGDRHIFLTKWKADRFLKNHSPEFYRPSL